VNSLRGLETSLYDLDIDGEVISWRLGYGPLEIANIDYAEPQVARSGSYVRYTQINLKGIGAANGS